MKLLQCSPTPPKGMGARSLGAGVGLVHQSVCNTVATLLCAPGAGQPSN